MRALLVGVLAVAVSGCGADRPAPPADAGPATIAVTSSAFTDGASIPEQFTCRGAGTAPPLAWTGAPPSAAALALVVVDPDAHDYYHWIALDLPAASTSLDGPAAHEARNSKGTTGWTPPCPPSGRHRYRFTVYALDAETGLATGAGTVEALDAIEEHAVAHGTLTGVVSASSG
ncbi:YbhB/YbcL family Raf kinase inhibitor-like protein [Nocardioides sp. CER19]|uniref:YbhB/YbcL family Raf kinase inhibitor-like protein n=1 Tax=Nocardioides sp. CER19 TaxID=3038538 RepID=UPI00244C4E4F|nr:YbhB/YbcL family Raf kinase inhibitor-like protein [Nocardioides sp. CER19]MDH2414698.1 YbhB/YbcL family Raf kinase inhibitor-like protein [Nocardioides sp. CER19]